MSFGATQGVGHIFLALDRPLTPSFSFASPSQAWKKRWFILRSGRLTGDPDVLEYYKNDHAKKPIRVIDLNLCEQVGRPLPTPSVPPPFLYFVVCRLCNP